MMNGSCNAESQYDGKWVWKQTQYLYIFTFLIGSHDLNNKEGDVRGNLFLAYVLNKPREFHRKPLLALERQTM